MFGSRLTSAPAALIVSSTTDSRWHGSGSVRDPVEQQLETRVPIPVDLVTEPGDPTLVAPVLRQDPRSATEFDLLEQPKCVKGRCTVQLTLHGREAGDQRRDR